MTDRKIRVLAISPIPEEGAGCRFRIAHYIPYLEAHGFDVTLNTLFTTDFFRFVYKPGHLARKAAVFAGLALKHLWSLQRVPHYDVIFIYREILPVGPAVVEWLLSMPGCPPIVFDFDDAIFLPSVSEANRLIAALKTPGKVATIVRRSTQVVVGNDYLGAYARQFNPAVTVIPTSVDTTKFTPNPGSRIPDPGSRFTRRRLDRQSDHGQLHQGVGAGAAAGRRAAPVRAERQRHRRAGVDAGRAREQSRVEAEQ